MIHVNNSKLFFIKLQKSNNCYNSSSIEKVMTTERFFEAFQQAYNSYDCSLLERFLSNDFIYESFFEFSMIKGKHDYMEYLTDKLRNMQKYGYKEKQELLYNSDTGEQVLILSDKPIPKQQGEYVCFVAESNDECLINKLTLTVTSFYNNLFLPKEALEDFEAIEADVDDVF